MSERQKIQKQLEKLREDCVKEYLEGKLSEITSKEVIHDILKEFIEVNNQEFLQNIAESIAEAKAQNKSLKEELSQKIIASQKTLDDVADKIRQESKRAQQQEVFALRQQYNQNIKELVSQNENYIQQIEQLKKQRQFNDSKFKQISVKIQEKQTQVSDKIKCQADLKSENSKLSLELNQTKKSFNKFKESCEKIINDTNKEKEKEKNRLIDEINKERQAFKLQKDTLLSVISEKEHFKDQYSNQQLIRQTEEMRKRQQQIVSLKTEIKEAKTEIEIFLAKQKIIAAEHSQLLYQIQQKTEEIITLTGDNSQLIQTISKLNQEKQYYASINKQSTAKLFQFEQETIGLRQKCIELEARILQEQQTKVSKSVAFSYLKQENQFLRQEIISFKSRFAEMEDDKKGLRKQMSQYKKRTSNEISSLKEQIKLQKQQYNTSLDDYHQQYETKIAEMNAQIAKLREELESYNSQMQKRQCEYDYFKEINTKLEEENEFLKVNLQLQNQQSEVHQKDIQQYENEILKIKKEHRTEIDLLKETLQNNWNSTNEELLQERYKAYESTIKLAELEEEILLMKDKQKYYSLYPEEIQQFKNRMRAGTETSTKCGSIHLTNGALKINSKQDVIYYLLRKMMEEIVLLKEENERLRAQFVRSTSEYNIYISQTIEFIIAKTREAALKCSFCEHQNVLKTHYLKINFNKKDETFQKTLPKQSSQSNNYAHIKKTLKNIQQRYQTVSQQNNYYSNHLQNVIKK